MKSLQQILQTKHYRNGQGNVGFPKLFDVSKSLIAFFVLIVAGNLTTFMVAVIWVGYYNTRQVPLVFLMLPIFMVEIILSILAYKHVIKTPIINLFNKPKTKHLLLACFTGISLHVLLQTILFIVAKTFNVSFNNSQTVTQIFTMPTFFIILFIGILIPISEELFFRGFLYDWMTNPKMKLLAPTVIFGILHFETFNIATLVTLIATMIVGFVSALYRKYTNNIWSSVCLHSTYNMLTAIIVLFI